MEPRFQTYSQTVCAHLRHATSGEKQSVAKELTDHLEDHAQVLLDAGYSEEDALEMALSAMGDPEEVGRELNKEYPLRWLILSRVLLVVMALLVLRLGAWVYADQFTLQAYHQAKTDPMGAVEHLLPPAVWTPVEVSETIPGGSTLSIFAVGTQGDTVYVWAVTYREGLFHPAGNFSLELRFLAGERPLESSLEGGIRHDSANYALYRLTGLEEGEPLTARYDRHGFAVDLSIPLP